ncbi:MAG TPA: hypothetical protein VGB85_26260, partial [Nannocystis sp.]
MRRSIMALSLALVACNPPKSGDDPEDGATTSTSTTHGTDGHSSAPTTGGSANGSGGDDGPVTTSATTSLPPSTTSPPDLTTSTDGSPPTTTDSATASASDPGGASVPFFPEETDGSFLLTPDVPKGECNFWNEDCPAGQKCMPFASEGAPSWDSLGCVPLVVDPAPVGAPCVAIGHAASGLDSCATHAICWGVDADLQGECVSLCFGDELDHLCKLSTETCVLANDKLLAVCLPKCDPLISDCPADQVCIPSVGEFACAPDVSGPGGGLFSTCAAGNACDPGLVCAGSENAAQCPPSSDECCLVYCDL